MHGTQRDRLWITLSALALAALTAAVFLRSWTEDWRDYQGEFRELVEQKFGPQRAALAPRGLQQIWVKELNRVDRCTTCHQGMEWRGLENAPHPFRTHPKELLDKHPLSRYGCSVCHGGQGYAVTQDAAHAVLIEHWEHPLLGQDLATAYTVSDRRALLQTNCNQCHRYDRETKGADYLNYAKQLVRDKGCRACHIINGRGGIVGPNLTHIGDQAPEQYDFSRIQGNASVFAWHVGHFKNPKSMAAETIMPNFSFGSREAHALSLLVMSWRRNELPSSYMAGVKVGDFPTPEEVEKEKQMMSGEGAFFVQKRCFICHDVSTLGIESAAKIGPDLALAVADTQSRFGKTLEDFLRNPTGTMAVVLATQIPLTDAEKAQAVGKLKVAYQKKLEQDAKKPPAR